ncbi:MAG: hypothetical protein MPK62_00600 [Alphaproteobacteria bacterium]|nr:hypothetical protein [Alphaproteobacteria bacterium]MDA8029637.1 hypothetical protein [Alphaproteobacteria bacterium]
MTLYEDYEARVKQALQNGDDETAKMYQKRMRNIRKCQQWREKKKEAAK